MAEFPLTLPCCVRTVPKLELLIPLGLPLSKKQIPQVIVNIRIQA